MPTKKTTRKTTKRPKRSASTRPTAKRKTARKSSTSRTPTRRKSTKRTSSHRGSKSSSTACIMGAFEGDITAKGGLRIADGAKCNANVHAHDLQVDGFVQGHVTARNQMKLGSKAKMKGEIVADKLVAAEGAAFVGHCRLGKFKAA